jgi:hypothetical protein
LTTYNPTHIATAQEVKNKLALSDGIAYIQAGSYITNPYDILGQVIQIRKNKGNCPQTINDPNFSFEFTVVPVQSKVNELSKLKDPILRSSIVVDKTLSLNVSFLSYLSAQFSGDDFFSCMVYDQATGRIDLRDADWGDNVAKWKTNHKDLMDDDQVCFLFVITGFVQKNIIRKKYIKYKAGVKGGAYGVNIDGQLATSTEEYSLDSILCLESAILKRPNIAPQSMMLNLVESDKKLFESMSGATASNNIISRGDS